MIYVIKETVIKTMMIKISRKKRLKVTRKRNNVYLLLVICLYVIAIIVDYLLLLHISHEINMLDQLEGLLEKINLYEQVIIKKPFEALVSVTLKVFNEIQEFLVNLNSTREKGLITKEEMNNVLKEMNENLTRLNVECNKLNAQLELSAEEHLELERKKVRVELEVREEYAKEKAIEKKMEDRRWWYKHIGLYFISVAITIVVVAKDII